MCDNQRNSGSGFAIIKGIRSLPLGLSQWKKSESVRLHGHAFSSGFNGMYPMLYWNASCEAANNIRDVAGVVAGVQDDRPEMELNSIARFILRSLKMRSVRLYQKECSVV